MFPRCSLRISIIVLTVAIGADLICQSSMAASATTQSQKLVSDKTECQLSLSPTILDPRERAVGAIRGINMYIVPFDLVDERPLDIRNEPTYVGKPVYGAFRIGNGPRCVTYFSIDESKGYAGKIYVDQNQNGDLTDDGPSDWDLSRTPAYGRYCQKTVTVHASWGTALEEKESGNYTLTITKPDGVPKGAFMKITGRTGNLKLGDKTYPIVLAENTGDGIFTVPADSDMTRRPVNLYIDTENSTSFEAWTANTGGISRAPQKFDIGHPFQIEGHWYIARPSISGASLIAQETTAPGETKPIQAVAPDKVPVGAQAPDFTVQNIYGKPVSLSDYKGKLVILDFWATWCGPCQMSMPILEKLHESIKDQDVVVLSVNVLDEKEPFDTWIAKHANKDYHFDFAFDPAGKEDNSVATSTYQVAAIPAWFLITRDGKIGAKETGFDGTADKLIRALREHNVFVKKD